MLIIKKGILDLDKGLTQGLDDTTITAEAKYSINFKQSGKKVLSFHYNRSNSFLYNALNVSIQSKIFRNKAISIVFR